MSIFKKVWRHLKYKYWLYYNVNFPQLYYSLRLGDQIQEGPFKALKYKLRSVGSVLTPKLIGTYEHELAQFFTKDFLNGYKQFIDIGSAEGYYVCGVRYLNTAIEIVAFESESKGRKQIKKNLELNKLYSENDIKILGECNSSNLNTNIKSDTLILCDIEGYEYVLLDPNIVSKLNDCDIIVELHHDINPLISSIMMERFKTSHDIISINKSNKQELVTNFKSEFIINNFNYLSNEFRKNESWLFLKKRKNNENFNI
jgi:hypothetical protein